MAARVERSTSRANAGWTAIFCFLEQEETEKTEIKSSFLPSLCWLLFKLQVHEVVASESH